MKAIIINEDKFVSEKLSSLFNEKNIETINYSWLLKALDNIEEIQPDIIVTNAAEYPRHWKILAQYLKSGIAGKNILFLLYSPYKQSDLELKKARVLDVDLIISSFDVAQIQALSDKLDDFSLTFDKFNENRNLTLPSSEAFANEEEDEELFSVDKLLEKNKDVEVPAKGYYILTNPVTGNFVSGKYLEYDGKRITCQIDNLEDFTGIEKNTSIRYVTYSNQFECKSFSAVVNDYLEFPNEKFIILNICNMYEEN